MKDFITETHLIYMGKVMLATGLIVVYGYVMEAFFGWYSASQYEVVHDQEPNLDGTVLDVVLDAYLL